MCLREREREREREMSMRDGVHLLMCVFVLSAMYTDARVCVCVNQVMLRCEGQVFIIMLKLEKSTGKI